MRRPSLRTRISCCRLSPPKTIGTVSNQDESVDDDERRRVRSESRTPSTAGKTSNPVPLPDPYFDSFSCPVASIVFGDMAIVSFFLANPRSCLELPRPERQMFKKVCLGSSPK